MLTYAGIDEAGYGPLLGPLVIACWKFSLDIDPGAGADVPPCLWEQLSAAVCRSGRDKRRRIAVDDSKKINSGKNGLEKLERGVLSFLSLGTGERPASLEALLERLAEDEESRHVLLPWYRPDPATTDIPACCSDEDLGIATSMLRGAAAEARISASRGSVNIVFEDRFNRLVDQLRNKARCSWLFVARQLWNLWQTSDQNPVWAVVDRQGGRTDYRSPLLMLFEGARLEHLVESETIQRYRLTQGRRNFIVSFEAESETRHLPSALASMTAKYLRERFMDRFNAHWIKHDPTLKPTRGYVQDGRRFMEDLDPLLENLKIDPARLTRIC